MDKITVTFAHEEEGERIEDGKIFFEESSGMYSFCGNYPNGYVADISPDLLEAVRYVLCEL